MNVLQQIRRIVRAAQRHSQLLEKSTGLPGAQLWALQEVVSDPGLRVGDLARRMHLHISTTSNLVDKLITGVIWRVRSKRTSASSARSRPPRRSL
ncbi:MAG: MarR family transcriptional regulator [Uliginosibacterium sp.]|nr:MarR family transcriptional regulator [Uliginosibacterium sp.]